MFTALRNLLCKGYISVGLNILYKVLRYEYVQIYTLKNCLKS